MLPRAGVVCSSLSAASAGVGGGVGVRRSPYSTRPVLLSRESERWSLRTVLICITPMTKGVEHFSRCSWAI